MRYRINRCHATSSYCSVRSMRYTRGCAPVMARTKYATTNLLPEVHESARMASLRLGLQVGRRLSLSDVIGAALVVADAHPDEWAAALRGPVTEEGTDAS